ncbi:DUF2800 domain-containing protein [Peptoniphilus asaccharolyticus]
MPDVHAKLSASGAHKWLNCPGSIKLEEDFPDKGSKYAEEGTLAHAVAELKLQKYFVKGIGPKTFNKKMDEFKKSEFWNTEMDHMTDIYFNEVKRKALSYKDEPFINVEERVNFSDWVPEGFGTADVLMIYNNELIIMDLKYGKGVPVSPENNPQLMLYALGAYSAYSWLYNIEKISLCIIQPRLDNIEYWELTIDELLSFGERIEPIAKDAFNGSDELNEGVHCRFCKAKSRCKARADKMFKAVEEIKAIEDVTKLSNEDLAIYLEKSKSVVAWIKDIEDEALASILGGEEVPGYKAVEGRSNRKIIDEVGFAEVLLNAGYEESLIYKPKNLETITNLEKLVGKKELAELGNGFIEKPKGKPTLVTESDKRPPYKKEAEEMFEKIN